MTAARPPRTAVIGTDSFIGGAYFAALKALDPETPGTTRRRERSGAPFLDLADPDVRPLRLRERGVKMALIAAAVSNVASCEREPAASRKVNVEGTKRLIAQLSEEGVTPVFFSSNAVLPESDGKHPETAPCRPGSEYGRQKHEVERHLAETVPGALVVRISKVHGARRGDGSLLDAMAERLSRGETVPAAFDQIFCPTRVEDVVRALFAAQARGMSGVLHVANDEVWSRYDLAVAVARAFGVPESRVRRGSMREIMGETTDPHRVLLDSARLRAEMPFSFTPVARSLADLKASHEAISGGRR